MKKYILLIGTICFSTSLYAQSQQFATTAQLQDLGSAWKNAQALKAQQNPNDIAMVYGGKDISLRPSIIEKTTVV